MEVNNGGESRLPSKRDATLSPSTAKAPVDLKRQKLDIPEEEGSVEKASGISDDERTVAVVAAAENDRAEEEAVVEGKVESEKEEGSNGKAVIDRKGKGILIEEEEEEDEEGEDDSDDDDDSSDDGNPSDGGDDSDFVDDPLAEVDLDNILPARTRRRVVHPSAYIANDLNGEDDDSDDSDA